MDRQFETTGLDYAIVAVYFIAVIAHGLWVSRGKESSSDYFLAGRGLPWYLIGFSLFASNMSGASFVGLMGASYDNGVVVFNYEWTATLVLVFFAFIILPHFLRHKIFTVPEFLEKRYDGRSKRAYSIFTLFAIMFIDTAGALYAGGLVITSVMPFLSLWQAVAILALVAGLYTILGGLGAVVVTDTVQAILLVIGAACIFYFGLVEIGGWSAMLEKIDASRLSLIRPVDDDFLPWPGLLGVILLGFYYWTLNQFVVQRTLGAADLEQGRKGALFAGFLKLPNIFLMILPGVFAIALYPDLENPDLVFPTLAFDLLPVGFRGLVLAALIAAIMSSLDSALNAAGTLVVMDFVKPLRPDTSDRMLVFLGRVVTGLVMIFGAVYAPMITQFESLFEYFQSALSYVIPPIVVVFIGGMLFRGCSASGAFWTIILALVVGIPLFIMKEVTSIWTDSLGLPEIHFTYMSIIMMLFGILTLTLITALEGGAAEDQRDQAGISGDLREMVESSKQRSWLGDYRIQACGLLVLTVVLLAGFW